MSKSKSYHDNPKYQPFIDRKLIEEPLYIVMKEREERKMAKNKSYYEGFRAGVEMMRSSLSGRYRHTNSVLKAINGTADVLIKSTEGENKDAKSE